MNSRERRQMDEHIAGGRRMKVAVTLACVEPQRKEACNNAADCKHEVACGPNGCGWEGEGVEWTEYGSGGTEPEDCPDCGGEVRADE